MKGFLAMLQNYVLIILMLFNTGLYYKWFILGGIYQSRLNAWYTIVEDKNLLDCIWLFALSVFGSYTGHRWICENIVLKVGSFL